MRQPKFRALRSDGNGWACGHYFKTPITAEFNASGGPQFFDSGIENGFKGRHCIVQDSVAHEIDPETLGEFTGLTDSAGREIYEGDIVKFRSHPEKTRVMKIEWNRLSTRFIVADADGWHSFGHYNHLEVIGNIHQNPELIPKP